MSFPFRDASLPSTSYTDPWTSFRGVEPSDDNRLKQMQLAWRAYRGQLTPPLKTRRGMPDDNVMMNLCRFVVDHGVSFLFGKGVQFTLDADQERSPTERWLDAMWLVNQQPLFLHRLAVNGAVCGQAFIKIRQELPFPRLYTIDPTRVTVKTADDDFTRVLQYVIRWDGIDPRTNKPASYRQVIQRANDREIEALRTTDGAMGGGDQEIRAGDAWTITDQISDPQMTLKPEVWTDLGKELWPWPFPPIVECQNMVAANDYWGEPDLPPDVIALNEAITRVASNINRIIRLHAHPKTWSKGLTENQIQQIVINPDGMIHLPSEVASIQNLEMASDLSSSLNYMQRLREALYELARVPEIASGKVEDLQYLSAMSMQILYGPLIEKNTSKRHTYGHLLAETMRRILIMYGKGDGTTWPMMIWPEVLPRDAMVEAQTAYQELQIGVSPDTLMRSLGRDPVKERRLRALDPEVVDAVLGIQQQQQQSNPSSISQNPARVAAHAQQPPT